MGIHFEELDDTTRQFMLADFDAEWAGDNPYVGKNLSEAGVRAFPLLVRAAIETGDDDSLIATLGQAEYWNIHELYERSGVARERRINIDQAATRLGLTEFNTWYVRGLSARLMAENAKQCQVYRGMEPKWEPAECSEHEDAVYAVELVYRGHRTRYWPEPGDPTAFSIPFGPGCHHSIRRHG